MSVSQNSVKYFQSQVYRDSYKEIRMPFDCKFLHETILLFLDIYFNEFFVNASRAVGKLTPYLGDWVIYNYLKFLKVIY